MPEPVQILIVEDEETDVLLLRHAFEQAGLPYELIVVRDGQEALEYLNGEVTLPNGVKPGLPALVLLDLKMPRLDGFQVLAWRAEQSALKHIPFVVLTSSSYDSDRERARELGAADFWVKPSSFRNLVTMVQELHARWLSAPIRA